MARFMKAIVSRSPGIGWVTLETTTQESDLKPGDIAYAHGRFQRTPNGSLLPADHDDDGATEYTGFLYVNSHALYVPIPDDRVYDVASAIKNATKRGGGA